MVGIHSRGPQGNGLWYFELNSASTGKGKIKLEIMGRTSYLIFLDTALTA
jgi:hypothetical protein